MINNPTLSVTLLEIMHRGARGCEIKSWQGTFVRLITILSQCRISPFASYIQVHGKDRQTQLFVASNDLMPIAIFRGRSKENNGV
jgi:hypothetical protein